MNLLLRPCRHEDESLRGFVWRLAQLNGIPSPITMYGRFFGKRASLPVLVSDILEKYQSVLVPASSNLTPEPDCGTNFILKTGFRICPLCFKAQFFIKEKWDYALLPYCVEHGCELINVANIERLWSIDQFVYFGTKQNDPECGEFIELLNYLETRLGFRSDANCDSFSAFDELTIDDFQRLIFLVGSFDVCSNLDKPRKAPIKSNISITIALLKHAAKTLVDWPFNIGNILKNEAPMSIGSRQVFKEYGAVHRALKKELVGPQYDYIKSDYENFLLLNWPDVIDKKSTWFRADVKSESDFITGTEFSRLADVRFVRIIDWVERGLLDGNIRQLSSGYRQITLKKGQERYLREIQKLLTLKDVCCLLGLTKKSARSLLECGLIKSIEKGKDKVWAVPQSKILYFIESLKTYSLHEEPNEEYRTLTYLRRYCTNRTNTQLADIIRKMVTARVDYIYIHNKNKRLTDNIHMMIDDYKICINNHALISIQELAKELGVKQEVTYHLVNSGLIETIKKGRAGRFVTRQSISNFQVTYVFLSEIARALGTSSKYLIETIIENKINMISGPTIDGGRQYILRRLDVDIIIDLFGGSDNEIK